MSNLTKDDLIPACAHRECKCAVTGDTIKKGDTCFWVYGVGAIRGDLDPKDILKRLANPPSPFPAKSLIVGDVSYQDLCEHLAQEFEAALVELKRRGLDYQFDDDALKEYRDLHPRQDA